MTNEEYLQTQQSIIWLAGMIKALPLREFIERIDKAETLAPFTDPTLWREGQGSLSVIKQIAQGLKQVKDKLPELSGGLK